jgi:RND family efflux transporter MFP subunit
MNIETSPPVVDDASAESGPTDGRRRRGGVALGVLVLIAGGYALFHKPAAPPPPPPAEVTVARPLVRDVDQWDDYVGRFAPSRTVEIRPRVSGEVVAVHFRDGDIVKAGQPLFTIDPRPFVAALDEARADAASARSALVLAKSDFARAARLKGDEAVSAGEVDSLRAKVQSTTAAVAAADARVRARTLDVEFTQVRAPIAGRISDRRVDPGNQISGGEGTAGTLLTTINAVDPSYFSFDASEALFLKAQRAGAGKADGAPVEIRLQDESDYRWKGRVDFIDNGLNQQSGTIRGRATIANPTGFLTPGMFGNMRLAEGAPARALLVPDSAVQSDQARKTLLVAAADGTVATREVQLGPVVDGLRVIRSGIAHTDRVVITGTQMAQPGSKVDAKLDWIAPDTTPANSTPDIPAAAQATFAR